MLPDDASKPQSEFEQRNPGAGTATRCRSGGRFTRASTELEFSYQIPERGARSRCAERFPIRRAASRAGRAARVGPDAGAKLRPTADAVSFGPADSPSHFASNLAPGRATARRRRGDRISALEVAHLARTRRRGAHRRPAIHTRHRGRTLRCVPHRSASALHPATRRRRVISASLREPLRWAPPATLPARSRSAARYRRVKPKFRCAFCFRSSATIRCFRR